MVNYKKPTMQLAIDMINESSGTAFRLQDIVVTDVKYKDEGYYNSSAVIKPTANSIYQDEVSVSYDRVNIHALFRGVSIQVPPLNQKKISDYLPFVNGLYDLQLAESDIVDGVIPESVTVPYRLKVEMIENNPAFYGSFEIIVTDTSKSLPYLIKRNDLRGIQYPCKNKDKIQAPLYFYGLDWTSVSDFFRRYPTRNLLDNQFVEMLNSYDSQVWVNSEVAQPFNLHQARVVYHGRNEAGNEYTNKQNTDNLFVIALDDNYCTNMTGYLIFHYNDKY